MFYLSSSRVTIRSSLLHLIFPIHFEANGTPFGSNQNHSENCIDRLNEPEPEFCFSVYRLIERQF